MKGPLSTSIFATALLLANGASAALDPIVIKVRYLVSICVINLIVILGLEILLQNQRYPILY